MKPDSAAEIVQRLRANGHQAYFVGGCVRDMVLGIEPADYDIATSALPEQVVSLFPRTEQVGAKFGVILVIYRGHPFEVATFRSDEAYIDGRRPTGVVFTDARQDVLRRDFTINGLLFDPTTKEILDFVSGQDDIRAKVVRAIGDPAQRFAEDKLRLLRAIRFGARLGYTIEPQTWEAIRQMAATIHQVSAERIREELVRILTEGQAAHGIRMLQEAGLLQEILPEVAWSPRLHRALGLLKARTPEDFAVSVLLHEVDPSRISAIVERLKFSRAEMHHILALVESLPKFAVAQSMSKSEMKRFLRAPRFEDYLELERTRALASNEEPQNHAYVHDRYVGWSASEIAPEPLIKGEDLIDLGFRPGPLFKEILTRIEDEQLEGRIGSPGQAIAFVRRNYLEGAS